MGLVFYGTGVTDNVVEAFVSSCPRCRSEAEHEERRQIRTWSIFFIRVPFIKRSADYLICTRCGTEKSYRDLVDLGAPRVRNAYGSALVAATYMAVRTDHRGRVEAVLRPVLSDLGLPPVDGRLTSGDSAIDDFKDVASPVTAANLLRDVVMAVDQIDRRPLTEPVLRSVGTRLLLPSPTIDEVLGSPS